MHARQHRQTRPTVIGMVLLMIKNLVGDYLMVGVNRSYPKNDQICSPNTQRWAALVAGGRDA